MEPRLLGMKNFQYFRALLYARWRAWSLVSCLSSPRDDERTGLALWGWLWQQRRAGVLVDPSIRIRGSVHSQCVLRRLHLSQGCSLDLGVIVWVEDACALPAQITLGKDVYVGPHVFLGSCHHLRVGAGSLIGGYSYLITANHRRLTPSSLSREPQVEANAYEGADITIGNNVWIGSHVTVLPGVSIGDRAVIGAGAVVSRSVPAGETWGGVPARPLHLRP